MAHKLINNTYEILDEIARGGMSTVFRARHLRLNTVWAIKQVSRKQYPNFDFLAESNILKRLDHPMLVRIVDIFEDADNVYIVEDYIKGTDLKNLLRTQKCIDEKTLISWFKDLCSLLIYLHEQKPNPIIYRDLKPGNLMLQENGKLKLIDFGIAREYKQEGNSDTILGGTYGYAAPEQFSADRQSDARTDIYSLGMTMHHLATGKSPSEPPYVTVPVRQLNPSLSPGLEHIIDRCTQLQPEKRYQSARELLDDLEHIYIYDDAYKAYQKKVKARKMTSLGLIVTGAAAVIAGFFLQSSETMRQYNDLLAQAENASVAEAVEIYQKAEALKPETPAAYAGEVRALYQSGDYEGTIARITEMEKAGNIQKEKNPDIYTLLGSAYFELSDYDHAIQVFEEVIREGAGDQQTALIDYTAALGRAGRYDEAEQNISQLLETADTIHAVYLQGELNAVKGNYRDAENSFLQVLSSADASDELKRRTYIYLAETYRDAQKTDSSSDQSVTDCLNKQIQLIDEAQLSAGMSYNTVLWEMKGQAYAARGRENDSRDDMISAAESYYEVIRKGVAKPYMYVNVMSCYAAAGDYNSALAILDEYESRWPDSFEPHAYRALILAEMQNGSSSPDYSAVIQEYETAKELMTSTDNTELIAQFEGLIESLKANGYYE
jgi:serine/threonine-protein kinase